MSKVLNNSGQMYKVFFNDRAVILCPSFKKSLPKNSLYYNVQSIDETKKAWDTFSTNLNYQNLYLQHTEIEELKKWFFSFFKILEAAGGLVSNNRNELLCIKRWGKWDLPKGKIEKGESAEMAALREVEEECGINGLELKEFHSTTYHIYPSPKESNKLILKPTYWYRMIYNGNETLKPQLNEDITEAKWLNEAELKIARRSTYPSLKDLFAIG